MVSMPNIYTPVPSSWPGPACAAPRSASVPPSFVPVPRVASVPLVVSGAVPEKQSLVFNLQVVILSLL